MNTNSEENTWMKIQLAILFTEHTFRKFFFRHKGRNQKPNRQQKIKSQMENCLIL